MTRILSEADEPPRRTQHGLTPDEIDYLKSLGCAICGSKARLQIDHDHSHHPGREGCRDCVCGVLCHGCNMAVYYMHDDPKIAERLVTYLRKTRWH